VPRRSRLGDLVEVEEGAVADGAGDGAIDPPGFTSDQEVAAEQVGGGGVLVAGDGDEVEAEQAGHVLDEPGFPAACRSLDHEGEMGFPGVAEDFLLATDREIKDGHRGAGWVEIGWFEPSCAGSSRVESSRVGLGRVDLGGW